MPHLRPSALLAAAVLAAATPARAVDPNFRIHADEFPSTPLVRALAITSTGSVPISSLTAEGYPAAPTLEMGPTWDFSGVTGTDLVQQFAPVAAGWSCYVPDPVNCGVSLPSNDLLLVTDTPSTGARDVLALDFNGSDTVFLRAQVFDEGTPAENRICFGPPSPDAPFLVFPNIAGARRYLAPGDAPYQSAVYNCVMPNVTQGGSCGAAGQSVGFDDDPPALPGRVIGEVRSRGTMTLPSGHVLDSVVVRVRLAFNLLFGCVFAPPGDPDLDNYQLIWLVPHYGPMVIVASAIEEPTFTGWTTAFSGHVGYGLLPPLDIQVDATTATSITVSWDPGRNTSFIDGYVVHWGTSPGNPTDRSAIVPAPTTSTTIPGLLPNTTYHVSVSSVKTYTDPSSSVTTEYHSIELPTRIGADVNGDGDRDDAGDTNYPPEVSAVTVDSGGSAELAANRQVVLAGTGPAPEVRDALVLCPSPLPICTDGPADSRIAGALPLIVPNEANATGTTSVWYYAHTDATTTMAVAKIGSGLFFLP